MIRHIRRVVVSTAVLVMALLVGSMSGTVNVSAKDDEGNIVIVIDPGHGGNDAGMVGVNGVQEDDANFAIATAMMNTLKQYSGVRVYLTRPEDSWVTNTGRAMVAAALDADFLISLHNNSGTETSTGAIVFTSVLPLYSTITADMGNYIINNLAALGLKNNGIQTRSSTEYIGEDYYTIMGEAMRAGVPAVLVEHCFLNNPNDVLFVTHEDGSLDYEKIALIGEADADAVVTYFNLQPNTIRVDTSAELELEKGYSVRAEAGTGGAVTWTSSNESAVTVDEYGLVTAVNSGSAVVTYTGADGASGSLNVKVRIPSQLAITGFIDPTFYKSEESFAGIKLDEVRANIIYSDGSVTQVVPDSVGDVDFGRAGIQDIPISYGALDGSLRIVYQTSDYIPEVTSKETEAETETETTVPETTESISEPEASLGETSRASEESNADFDFMMVIKMAAGIIIVIVLATVVFLLENRVSRRRRGRRNKRRRRY